MAVKTIQDVEAMLVEDDLIKLMKLDDRKRHAAQMFIDRKWHEANKVLRDRKQSPLIRYRWGGRGGRYRYHPNEVTRFVQALAD